MRAKTKGIVFSTALCAYVIIKEALNLDRRQDELDAYEKGVNNVVDFINEGEETEKVINIRFK